MLTHMYYFSGTGNSLAVARKLADQLGQCQLIPIAEAVRQSRRIAEIERIGFVFPLYYTGLPKLVYDFLTDLEFSTKTVCFMVATRGLPPTGGVIQQVKRMLKTKGVTLQAGFYVNMPQNYIPWFEVPAESKQQRLFQQADTKIQKIATILRAGTQKYDFEPLGFMLPFRNTPYLNKANELDRNFHLQNGSCNGCGICAQVCPVNNIVLNGGVPEWKHTCQECLACLNFCPKQAIQHGKKTANRSRYHHPEVTLKDIMSQKDAVL